MDILTAQIITIVSFFLAMLLSCLIPIKLVPKKSRGFSGRGCEIGMGVANCLSAGVFIATFFVGLLPEVRRQFEGVLYNHRIITSFPITEFVVFLGFFLALFVEQLLVSCRKRVGTSADSKSTDLPDSAEPDLEDGMPDQDLEDAGSEAYTPIPEDISCCSLDKSINQKSVVCHDSTKDVDANCHGMNGDTCQVLKSSDGKHKDQMKGLITEKDRIYMMKSPDSDHRDHSHDDWDRHSHHHDSEHGHGHSHNFGSVMKADSGVRLAILLLSLGTHSIFEGMTLGLQTRLRELLNLFAGVLIHECLVAFAVGVSMARTKMKFRLAFQLSVLFSITLPMGQIAGVLIGTNQSLINDTVNAVLLAVATGTFIHVTFLEVIPEGLSGDDMKMMKIFFVFIGFAIICIIPLMTDHHAHDSNHENFVDLYELKENITHTLTPH